MMKHLALTAAVLSLCACGPSGGTASAGSTPAPTSGTSIPPPTNIMPPDVSAKAAAAISVAFDALDAAAYASDALVLAKPSVVGTPAARQLADGLVAAKMWLNAASMAQRVGEASNYADAIAKAATALASVRTALASMKGN